MSGRVVDRISAESAHEIKQYMTREDVVAMELEQAEDVMRNIDALAMYRNDLRAEHTYVIEERVESCADDAVTVQEHEIDGRNAYTVSIHTVDVPFFVQEDSMLDIVSQEKGRTVYTERDAEASEPVIPVLDDPVDRWVSPDGGGPDYLLPEPLRDDICELSEGEPRLANTVELTFKEMEPSADGLYLVDQTHYPSIIQVDETLSFDEADEKSRQDVPSPVERQVDQWYREALAGAPYAPTYADSDGLSEAEIAQDMQSLKIVGTGVAKRQGHWGMQTLPMSDVIGLFQNAVNRYGTEQLLDKGRGLFRIHGNPQDWERGVEQHIESLGYTVEPGTLADADDPLHKLDQLYWNTEEERIGELYDTVRNGNSEAQYAPVPLTHEGVGNEVYAQFTAPKRRYADIENWRILNGASTRDREELHRIADHLNLME